MSFAKLTRHMAVVVFGILGEPVTLLPEDADPFVVTGLFKADHEEIDVSTGIPISSVQPVLEVRALDAGDIEEGDRAEVQGVLYQIVDVRPDGHGTLKVFLHKISQCEVGDENVDENE